MKSNDLEVDLSTDVDPDPETDPEPTVETDADGTRRRQAPSREELQQHAQQLKQIKQRRTEVEKKIEQFQETVDRLDMLPAERRVMQSLAGGVSLEVPPEAADYDRTDLMTELEATLEDLVEYDETLEERADKLERALKQYQQDSLDDQSQREEPLVPEVGDQPYSTEEPR